MRFLPQFKRQQVTIAAISGWNAGIPMMPPRNYRTYALEAFAKSPIVYACVATKAQSATDIKLKAQQLLGTDWVDADDPTKRTPEADELQALLDHPNPRQSQTLWLQDTITCEQVAGNSYTQIELSRTGRPVALWHLPRPEVMSVIPDDQKLIGGYVYNTGKDPIPLAPEVVLHFRGLPDPLNPLLGMSPLVVLARDLDADNAATDMLKQFFDKGGVPALAAIFKSRTDQKKANEFRAMWESRFSIAQGGNQAGGLAILNADEVELQKIGSTTGTREMGLQDIRQVIEARVCGAYRVHPQVAFTLLGFVHPTYGQARMAEEVTWQMGLVPMYTRLADIISIGLRPYFPHCRVVTDYSQVPALQEDEDAKWKRHQAAADSGLETREEMREAVGLPAEPKGTFLVPYNRVEQVPGEPLAPRVTATETIPATIADIERQQGDEDAPADPGANQLPPHTQVAENVQPNQVAAKPRTAGKAYKVSPRAQRHADRMEALRRHIVEDTTPKLDEYFAGLKERVLHRLNAQDGKALQLFLYRRKDYPFTIDDLLPESESRKLAIILKPLWLQAMEDAWDAAATEFDLDASFSVTNPEVERLLREASSDRVTEITDATRDALRAALATGAQQGYSTFQLAHGVEADGFAGLDSIVEQLYANRSEAVARTESMWASNRGALALYASEGVEKAELLDGDGDPECAARNGQIVSMAEAEQAVEDEHPNGTLAVAPVVE